MQRKTHSCLQETSLAKSVKIEKRPAGENGRLQLRWIHAVAGILVVIPIMLRSNLPHYFSARSSLVQPDSGSGKSSQSWADESRCSECHEQGKRFADTGHARTLSRATVSDSAKLLSALRSSTIGVAENVAVQTNDSGVLIRSGKGLASKEESADWCFGSGTHARTWVGTLDSSQRETESLEFRWTWYRSTGSFDVTPGQSHVQGLAGLSLLGLQFDAPRTWRCFSCHSTQLNARNGRLNETDLVAGVTCQRCHGPRGHHVETAGQWHDAAWIPLDREDSIRRCAECHRSPEEQAKELIRPDNLELVRFQPVGLTQSECYKQSQMTCTTCHDPHRPLEEQDSKGAWQCIQCHDPAQPSQHPCADGQIDGCVGCHLPKVQVDSPLSFSDHWIRVRRQAETNE